MRRALREAERAPAMKASANWHRAFANGHRPLAWTAAALLLALAACNSRTESSPAQVEKSAAALSLGTAAPTPAASACTNTEPFSPAPGWLLAPVAVAAGSTQQVAISGVQGPALIVLQNGDGLGALQVDRATVLLDGAPLASIDHHKDSLVAAVGVLTGSNSLAVSAAGASGTVRVAVASLATPPCPLISTSAVIPSKAKHDDDHHGKGSGDDRDEESEAKLRKTFKRPDSKALGVVVISQGAIPAGGTVKVNGKEIPGHHHSASGIPEVAAISLLDSNTLEIEAKGRAGASLNVAVLDVDTTAPALAMTAPDDGASVNSQPIAASGTAGPDAISVMVSGVTATLVNSNWSASVPLAAGHNAIAAEAKDFCGNTARVCRDVALAGSDTPKISITGVTAGQLTNQTVAISWTVSDVHPGAAASATLDGAPFANGSVVDSSGKHTLVVSATCPAGGSSTETVTFEIDLIAPAISVTGVSDGMLTNQPVIPVFSATDPNLNAVSAKLDGPNDFASGTTVSSEGDHVLVVTADDKAGNSATQTVNFTVDLTPPVITITGVAEGLLTNQPVTPGFGATDAHTATIELTILDGLAFVPGTTIASDGPHTLEVTAQDGAGNRATQQVHFTLDLIAPVISLTGVNEGDLTNKPVTPIFSATDTHLGQVTATLDGAAFASGTAVSDEGDHVLVVTANDTAGNSSSQTVHFTIDVTQPAISISGVAEGDLKNAAITPVFSATDLHLSTTSATIDGAPFASGTAVSAEGDHVLVVSALDGAGNKSSQTIHFTIDLTAPVISLTGVKEGDLINKPVTPVFSATDTHLGQVTATLDGAAFSSGAAVSAEGDHVLVVTANDKAGNSSSQTVHFTIDLTPPAISVSGVAEGDLKNAAVTPVFDATDLHLASSGATLNGNAFTSGTIVSAEGDYTLVVSASDSAGNKSSQTVHFTIDSTPPVISLTGVKEGDLTNKPVTPVFSATDTHLGQVTATLDGADFASGTTVSAEGDHVLVVTANDTAGNSSSQTVHFTIDLTPPAISVSGVAEGDLKNAAVTPVFDAADLHLASSGATLNGNAFTSGTVVSAEGNYTLVVSASDGAGNKSSQTVHFTIDSTPPVISLTGVKEGDLTNKPVTPVFGATDAHLGQVTATLDGAAFASGTTVSAEGDHVLVVTANDTAGNSSSQTVHFTIDVTPPAISISGVAEGDLKNAAVTPVFSATDLHLTSSGATLDGAPFASGTAVSTEGDHILVVSAADGAGNKSSQTAHFTVDVTPPAISLSGVNEGDLTNKTVTPVFGATDTHLGQVAATLDGVAFASGTAVSAEGDHLLVVTANDKAGNSSSQTAHFTIDVTPPAISVSGVAEGDLKNAAITPVFSATDLHLSSSGATLDGAPFASGTAVSTEGDHILVVSAADGAGNKSSQTVHFTVDLTPPVISLTGVKEGDLTNKAVTPVFSATDLHLNGVSATLDTSAFASGTALSAEGDHVLVVTAADKAGNTASQTVHFTQDFTKPVLALSGAADGEVRNTPATLSFSATDAHLAGVTSTLDSSPISSGATVSADGAHVWIVTASDGAGNSASEQRKFTIDTTPPSLVVQSPQDGSFTKNPTVEVAAQVTDGVSVSSVSAGAVQLLKGTDGIWRATLSLVEGANVATVVAYDGAGNSAQAVFTVYRDSTSPAISLSSPTDGARIGALTTAVVGTLQDASACTVTVNGVATSVSGGSFSADVTLVVGANTVTVSATDSAGNNSTVSRNVRANVTPPTLTLSSPADGLTTSVGTIAVIGTARPADTQDSVVVKVNGSSVPVDASGRFIASVTLQPGANPISVTASDGYGFESQKSVTVSRPGAADAGTPPPTPDASVTPPAADAGSVATPDASITPIPTADAGTAVTPDAASTLPSAPALFVDVPSSGAVLGGQRFAVSGRIQDGTPPFSVTVNGTAASVAGATFSTSVSLPEGDQVLTVQAKDATGRLASAQLSISVDRTAPIISITRPSSSPSVASNSPYRIEGTAGDPHLAGVWVNGSPVAVVADGFSATVPLQVGSNSVRIEARDSAGNTSSTTQVLTLSSLPPAVSFVSPADGSQADGALITVKINVSSSLALSSVNIGTAAATPLGNGEYTAQVPLGLGDNVITASATDQNGATGTASIHVGYLDQSQVPLAVTGVSPEPGAVNLEPSSLISVAFNKPILAGQDLSNAFAVNADGRKLLGGFFVAPGQQTVSFVARGPLPEGARLVVAVSGVQADSGPSQSANFTSDLTVRPPLTRLRGLVVDEELHGLSGVAVTVEETGQSIRTGPDGNFMLFDVPEGLATLRYEGGSQGASASYPTVRRRLYVQAQKDNPDKTLLLYPTDTASAQAVDATQALHLTFGGTTPGLALDLPENSFAFANGTTRGFVTATKIPRHALPVPLEARAAINGLWQVQPAGTWLTGPVAFALPNLTNLPPGRLAMIFAYDRSRSVLARVAIGHVTTDGVSIVTDGPVSASSLEYFGYAGMTEAQSIAVAQAMASSGIGSSGGASPLDGGTGFLVPFWQKKPMWQQLVEMVLPSAHAQYLGGFFAPGTFAFDSAMNNSLPARVHGTVRAPKSSRTKLTRDLPAAIEPYTKHYGPIPASEPAKLELAFTATYEPDALNGQSADKLFVALSAVDPSGRTIAPEKGKEADWKADGTYQNSTVKVTAKLGNPVVELREGTTKITVTATSGTDIATKRLEAKLTRVGIDGGIDAGADAGNGGCDNGDGGDAGCQDAGTADSGIADAGTGVEYDLELRTVYDSEDGTNLDDVVRFQYVGVEVIGPDDQGAVTGESGGYSALLQVDGTEAMGVACAKVPATARTFYRSAPDGGVMQVPGYSTFDSCSVSFGLFPGMPSKADILVDARLLHGALTFVNREGKPLPPVCDIGAKTVRNAQTDEIESISAEDVATTEVHFFRSDNLEVPIAQYTVGGADVQSGCDPTGATLGKVTHGGYTRMHLGPTAPSHRAARQRCRSLEQQGVNNLKAGTEPYYYYQANCKDNRNNFLRLSAGDELVAFAINHATGFAGLTKVRVPAINAVPSGPCQADVDQGKLKFYDQGEVKTLSRCTQQSIGIPANITLFPPEIEVKVARAATEFGVIPPDAKATGPEHLIRTGGAGTTRDSYVRVETRWRVRQEQDAGADAGDGGDGGDGGDAGVDSGSDSGVDGGDGGPKDAGVGPIHDTGDAGLLLEKYCSELPVGMQSSDCLKDDSLLIDVPKGVPPLAGHIVQYTGSVFERAVVEPFDVTPGPMTKALLPGIHVQDSDGGLTVANLAKANYYVHVVGSRFALRDLNGNGIIEDFERDAGVKVPDFTTGEADGGVVGLPLASIQLKDVYRAYERNGALRERFDRSREHEFRVIDIGGDQSGGNLPTVLAHQGQLPDGGIDWDAGTRDLTDAGTPAADEYDTSYQLLGTLLEPPEGNAPKPGTYAVRLGTDEFGIDCKVTVDPLGGALTGDCGGEALADVLTAGDMLYIELFLSGNAENVLYRFNFYGLAPRRDFMGAGSDFTAEQSVVADTSTGAATVPALGRATSQASLAQFFLLPSRFKSGSVSVCTAVDTGLKDCAKDAFLKNAEFLLNSDGTYSLTDNCDPKGKIKCKASRALYQEPEAGVDGARRFRLPLPPELDSMPGSSRQKSPIQLTVVVKDNSAKETPVYMPLGLPRGRFGGFHSAAPGQEQVGGVNVADGHLSFEHEDQSVRVFSETIRFARIYNNQNKEPSPLGTGWTHNWAGFLAEEDFGRYAVVLAGQTYGFPSCTQLPEDALDCQTDKSHSGTLTVSKASTAEPEFVFTSGAGLRYRFDRRARVSKGPARNVWLMTAIDTGYARIDANGKLADGKTNQDGWTVLSYLKDSDLLDTVKRGQVTLQLGYTDVDKSEDTAVPFRFKNAALKGLRYLTSAKLTGNPDVTYKQQRGNLIRAERGGSPKRIWLYEYEEPKANTDSVFAELLRSEMKAAELRLTDPEEKPNPNGIPTEYKQWRATFERDLNVNPKNLYAHVNAASVISKVTLPGQAGAHTISYQGAASRELTRPDAVTATMTLNQYGNVKSQSLPVGPPSAASWASDQMGQAVWNSKRVSPGGREIDYSQDGRLRSTSVTFSKEPGDSTLEVMGLKSGQKLVDIPKLDDRYGLPSTISMRGASGLVTVGLTPDKDGHGDIDNVTVEDASGQLQLKQVKRRSADGVVEEEIDSIGRTLVYSVPHPVLGLPQHVKVSHPKPDGGLPAVNRDLTYDGAGRLLKIEEKETGAGESWAYDDFGRVLEKTHKGFPSETYRYKYRPTNNSKDFSDVADPSAPAAFNDKALTIVEERLDGTNHLRTQYFADGLMVGETYHYGLADSNKKDQLAVRKYSYKDGQLRHSVDERGISRDYSYDTNGRLSHVDATDPNDANHTPIGEFHCTEFTGDGQPLSITGKDGLVTKIAYDQLGAPAQWDYGEAELGGARDVDSVTRDSRGNVVKQTLGAAKKHVINVTVDAFGRAKMVASDANSAGGVSETRTFDAEGRPLEITDDETGLSDHFEYNDVLGRQTLHKRTISTKSSSNGVTTTLTETETRKYVDFVGTTDPDTKANSGTVVTIERKMAGLSADRTEKSEVLLDPMGRVLKRTEYVPDASGSLDPTTGTTALIPAVSIYTYDARGLPKSVKEPEAPIADVSGSIPGGTSAQSQARYSSIDYDAMGNQLQVNLSDNTVVTFTPDAAGQVLRQEGPHPDEIWTFQYDLFGRLSSRTLAPASGSLATGGTWKNEYYPAQGLKSGQVRQTDPEQYETLATFNARGKLLKQEVKDSGGHLTSLNSQVTENAFDGPYLTRQRVYEASAKTVVERRFDDRGRVLYQDESWSKGTLAERYVTDSPWTKRTADVTRTSEVGTTQPTVTSTLISSYEVDSLGNLISRRVGSAATPDRWLYDAAGSLIWQKLAAAPETKFTYVEGLLTNSVLEPGPLSNERTSYTYYPDRRLRSVSYPSGRSRRYGWDLRGLLALETYGTDAESQTTRYLYDRGGYLASVTQALGTSDEAKTDYLHGPRGETLQVTLPEQTTPFTYGYDKAGRLSSIVAPTGSPMPERIFWWDYLGRSIRRSRNGAEWTTTWSEGEGTTKNPEGDIAIRQHDGSGRVVHVQFQLNSNAAVANTDLTAASWAFDADGKPLKVAETHRSGDVETQYSYFDTGLLQTVNRTGAGTVGYTYSPQGQLWTVSSPAGTTTYGYDAFGRLGSVGNGAQFLAKYTWEPGGELVQKIEGNVGDLIERRCYDGHGRVHLLAHVTSDFDCSGATGAALGAVSAYAYDYDERGNRTKETYFDQKLPFGEETNYWYDKADRLVGVVAPDKTATFWKLHGDGSRDVERRWTVGGAVPPLLTFDSASNPYDVAYGYDGLGSLQTLTGPGSTVLAQYVSDRAGRVVSEDRPGFHRAYGWDVDGRLANVTVTAGTATTSASYLYDADGLRHSKSGATSVAYLWSAGKLLEEQQGPASVLYSHGANGEVIGLGGQRALHDALGSTTGRGSTLYRTDAWGNQQSDPGDASHWTAPPAAGPSLGFGAMHWDADAGLHYAQQRWLDSATGRWLTEDPVFGDTKNPMSLNLWLYANGNPLTFLDPTGERAPTREEQAFLDFLEAGANENWKAYADNSLSSRIRQFIVGPGEAMNASVLERHVRALRAAIERAADGEAVLPEAVSATANGMVSVRLAGGGKADMWQFPAYLTETEARGRQILANLEALSFSPISGPCLLFKSENDQNACIGSTATVWGVFVAAGPTVGKFIKKKVAPRAEPKPLTIDRGVEFQHGAPTLARVEPAPASANSGIPIRENIAPAAKKPVLASFEDIVANPQALAGKSVEEVGRILGADWSRANYGKTGTGWKYTKGDKMVFYHEGGRHKGAYYGFSSGKTGKVKIVGEDYVPLPGDKATIIDAEN